MEEKEYLTVKELCEWIRLSQSKVYSLINNNEIPYSRIGGKILFNREKINIWIESQSK